MESNNIELITRMVIQAINQNEKKGDGFMVPIGVSARHIHLTQEHVEALFGPGYQLTKKKSAPIAIVGPKGAVYLKEGCIVAMRHIHMSPKDAQAAGVKDGDIVSVKADNERGTIFNQVKIRVDDSFTLEMHIDTNEANAAKIATGTTVTIIK